MELFGSPPVFPNDDEEQENTEVLPDKGQGDVIPENKAKGKKVYNVIFLSCIKIT